MTDSVETEKKPRGFALLDPRVHREESSKGGRTTHALGKLHKWDRETAAVAGRKGAAVTHARRAAAKKAADAAAE